MGDGHSAGPMEINVGLGKCQNELWFGEKYIVYS